MRKPLFEGAATALITPMTEKGVDFEKLDLLINWQISEGIDALVICGTTGEKATLTDTEHVQVLHHAVTVTNGSVPIIAGTGSNDTAHAVWLTKEACSIGCDGVLVSTPYYNKTTQNGLVKMFNTIADASEKPLIIYNVPSRTGIGITAKTYKEIFKHPNIGGVKEASGDISLVAETLSVAGDDVPIYSGNDDQIVPIMSLGGKGVISVLSNVLPKETHKICEYAKNGNFAEARKLQLKYIPFIKALFSEVNPIPVKSAMAKLGKCQNILRLPLVPMENEHEEKMFKIMQDLKII